MSNSEAPHIIALILAAGAGRRLGGIAVKPLLPLPGMAQGDTTFIERHVELLNSFQIKAAVVVPLDQFEQYRFLEDRGAIIIANPESALTSGSTMSVRVGLEALAERDLLTNRDIIIMDCDIVYQRALLAHIVDVGPQTCVAINPTPASDDEEVRVYGNGCAPYLIGKGLPHPITAGLTHLGESVGVIRVAKADIALLRALARWLVGMPPQLPAFGFARQLSEHEEIWQYFCALGKMTACILPSGMAFAECDTNADYQHILETVLPAIRERDSAPHGMMAAAPL